MESYHKLVRDKIPAELDKKGIPYEQNIAGPEEYRRRLIEKLQEETAEFAEAGNVEELADVLEVIDALKQLPEFSSVQEIQAKKRNEKGSFSGKIILKGEK